VKGAYLSAERVESAISGIESAAIILSLNINPPIEILSVIMLVQTDSL
jgi:hypothetical protein